VAGAALGVLPVLACAALVAGCLVAEHRHSRLGLWLAKPLASAAFLWAALAWGALGSPFGRWLLLGLAACALGDVLLIPRAAPRALRAGMLAFGAGHALFAVAFLRHGVSGAAAAWTGVAVLLLGAAVARWLWPRLGPDDRLAVGLYLGVIAFMGTCAGGALARGAPWAAVAGALLFALSDLAVAQDRFVAPSFTSTLWGLPTYYAAQLLLAGGAAAG
jgi:uncharacterized membrane protein YhhN